MNLHNLGVFGIVIAAASYLALALGMLFYVPWYRSDIGRSLMASKSMLALLFTTLAVAVVFDLDPQHPAIDIPRAIIFMIAPFVGAYQFYVLFIKHQIMGSRKRREFNGQEGSGVAAGRATRSRRGR